MINYVLIIVGVILAVFGLRQLMIFVSELDDNLQRVELILKSKRFEKIENLNTEVDELNYSYYEILDDLSAKVDELSLTVSGLEQSAKKSEKNLFAAQFDAKLQAEVEPEMEAVIVEESEVKKKIKLMIDEGFSDAEIAKNLEIGSGEVAIIRALKDR